MNDEIILKSAEGPIIPWVPVDNVDDLSLGERVNWFGKIYSVKSKEDDTITLEDPNGQSIPDVRPEVLQKYYKRFDLDTGDSIIIYATNADPMYYGPGDIEGFPIGKDRPYSSESKQNIGKGRNVPYGKERGAGPYGGGDQPARCLDGGLDGPDTGKIKKHVNINKNLFEKVQSTYRSRYGDTWNVAKFWR